MSINSHEQRRLTNRFRLVFANISTHGVKIFAVKCDLSKLEKAFWGCAVVVAFMLICLSFNSFVALLRLYPSTTTIQIRTEKMAFPAVTACNTGKYKKSVVSAFPTFTNMDAAFAIVNIRYAPAGRKKRNLHDSLSSIDEITNVAAAEALLRLSKHNSEETVAEQPHGHIIVKRSTGVMCKTCIYSSGMRLAISSTGNYIYPNASTNCQNSDGFLPTFKSLAEINTFTAIKEQYRVSKGWGTFYNWVGYKRATVTSSFLNDYDQTALPTGSLFAVNDTTNLCLLHYSDGKFTTFPCLDQTAIDVPISDVLVCLCPLQCKNFTIPTNIIVQNLNLNIYSTVNFARPPGYYMTGSSSTFCNASASGNMSWTSAPPTCTQSVCPSLVLTNQIANATNSNLTNQIGFACPIGFDLIGQSVISCIANGSLAVWSSNPPLCSVTTTTSTTTTSTTTTTPTTCTTTSDMAVQCYSTQQFLDSLQFTDRGDAIAAADQLNNLMEFLLSYLNITQMSKLGFQRDELIRSCQFNKETCRNSDIELVEIPELLNCYTFNHRNQQTFKVSQNLGEESGLTLIFDVQLDEYISTVLVPGVQLFTQEQIDPLMYGAMGIVLSPGLTYHVSIAKFIEQKLSVPARPCIAANSVTPNYIFSNQTFFPEGCLRSYIQYKIVAKCGCGSPKYPLPINQRSQICNITGATCVMSFLQSDGHKLVGEAQRICPIPCRKNIVMLKLYQQTDITIIYTEHLEYDVSTILASIGGSIGCIAGMSLVSIVEIVVLIAVGILYRCH